MIPTTKPKESPMSQVIARRAALAAVLSAPALGALAQAPGPRAFEPTAPAPDTPRPLSGERILGRVDAPVAATEY